MKPEHHRSTSTHSVYVTVPLLLVVVSPVCVHDVAADILNPEQYHQFVSDMKDDIKSGRATFISSSDEPEGRWNIMCSSNVFIWWTQGRLSLSTVGDKCAKDNFGGKFYYKFNKFLVHKNPYNNCGQMSFFSLT